MKKYSLIISVQFLALLSLAGCASFSMSSPSEDPIAAAAARFHDPAASEREPASASESLRESQSAPLPNHITLGMSMSEVRSIWGEPTDVESAGDARDGNQRWTYSLGLSGRWGLSSKRMVYFESGQVAGWKNHH